MENQFENQTRHVIEAGLGVRYVRGILSGDSIVHDRWIETLYLLFGYSVSYESYQVSAPENRCLGGLRVCGAWGCKAHIFGAEGLDLCGLDSLGVQGLGVTVYSMFLDVEAVSFHDPDIFAS